MCHDIGAQACEPEPADQSTGLAPFVSRFIRASPRWCIDLDRSRTRMIHLCGLSWLVGAEDATQIDGYLNSVQSSNHRLAAVSNGGSVFDCERDISATKTHCNG